MLARSARTVLDAIGRGRAELSVVLTTDAEIRALNREWRGRDRPTDVLSFSLIEGPAPAVTALGDVVISLETARRQALENGWTLAEEVDRLLVHGVLHLVGYDHEVSPAEARRMQRKERAILGRLAADLSAARARRGSSRGARARRAPRTLPARRRRRPCR
ncbi:MAG: putative rRNA maturation factor [Candidatus Binatota bacterium]|nr:putative rRNA maturation factor [Candidatus Binatota bacterium]